MLVFPLVAFLVCRLFALSTEMTVIAVIFSTCPTSPAGFPLAKQMGGDASLMATIISLQTALGVIAIPTAISLAQVMA
jgi:malonate transporter and related proteins